jgi:hypothetical protein
MTASGKALVEDTKHRIGVGSVSLHRCRLHLRFPRPATARTRQSLGRWSTCPPLHLLCLQTHSSNSLSSDPLQSHCSAQRTAGSDGALANCCAEKPFETEPNHLTVGNSALFRPEISTYSGCQDRDAQLLLGATASHRCTSRFLLRGSQPPSSLLHHFG